MVPNRIIARILYHRRPYGDEAGQLGICDDSGLLIAISTYCTPWAVRLLGHDPRRSGRSRVELQFTERPDAGVRPLIGKWEETKAARVSGFRGDATAIQRIGAGDTLYLTIKDKRHPLIRYWKEAIGIGWCLRCVHLDDTDPPANLDAWTEAQQAVGLLPPPRPMPHAPSVSQDDAGQPAAGTVPAAEPTAPESDPVP